MANEDLKVKIAVDYVRDNYTVQTDQGNYGAEDYWMDGRGVMYYGSGDSEDLCFLLHSLLLYGGISSDRLRTYHGYYQSPTVLYGLHSWVGYKRPSDNKWVVIDPVYGEVFDDVDDLPEMLYTQYYIYGYAWMNEVVYVTISDWTQHFLEAYVNVSLPVFTVSALGAPLYDVALTLPALVITARGGGYVVVTLPTLDSVGTGIQGKVCNLVQDLPILRIAATGVTGCIGSLSEALESLEVTAGGYVDTDGSAAATLIAIEVYATGIAVDRFEDYILRHSRW